MNKYLFNLKEIDSDNPKKIIPLIGGKGFRLWTVSRVLSEYPETWVVSSRLFGEFAFGELKTINNFNSLRKNTEKFISEKISAEISNLPDILYAVRSSATIEDSEKRSFAGMFESKLNVRRKNLIKSINSVWLSCFGKRIKDYINKDEPIEMAVLIQPMIQPKFSGVCFSKHPLPNNIRENNSFLIEIVAGLGEGLVQGKTTPLCLTGTYLSLSSCTDYPWVSELLSIASKLESFAGAPVDVEFAVDNFGKLWILQQRPVTKLIPSNILDMTGYKKAYKRNLCAMDIEFLIDGCCKYLAPYLEIQADINRWMVMITNKKDGQQELWINELIDGAIVTQVANLAEKDPDYLQRIETRYKYYHNKILNWRSANWANDKLPLLERLMDFYEFALPINAHYYVPMHIIEALSRLILEEMRKINPGKSDDEFFTLATHSVTTLGQIFAASCKKIYERITADLDKLPNNFNDLPEKLKQEIHTLAEQCGFLNCHQPYESAYSAEEVFQDVIKNPHKDPELKIETEQLKQKYSQSKKWQILFEHLTTWLTIRNQQMEYLYYLYSKAAALLKEVGDN